MTGSPTLRAVATGQGQLIGRITHPRGDSCRKRWPTICWCRKWVRAIPQSSGHATCCVGSRMQKFLQTYNVSMVLVRLCVTHLTLILDGLSDLKTHIYPELDRGEDGLCTARAARCYVVTSGQCVRHHAASLGNGRQRNADTHERGASVRSKALFRDKPFLAIFSTAGVIVSCWTRGKSCSWGTARFRYWCESLLWGFPPSGRSNQD